MEHLTHLNWLAVATTGLIYFALGSVWFSKLLFAKTWIAETKVDINSGKGKMGLMMGSAVACSFGATIATALIVSLIGTSSLVGGSKLGLLCGLGFVLTSTWVNNIFESRSFKLILINSFYHVVGITQAAIILSIWK